MTTADDSPKVRETVDPDTEAVTTVDLQRVMIEIDEEVKAKRASGEIPAELERELDMAFARFAPASAMEGDFEALITRAEGQTFIDLLAPNESARPGVPHIKRVVQKTVRWYMRYIADQVGGFAHTITKATRALGDRVNALEQMVPPAVELPNDDGAANLRLFETQVIDELQAVQGRVLHARAGDGNFLRSLKDRGVDIYGVDPSAASAALAASGGADVRPDDERSHLRSLKPEVLGGILLTGSVDILAPGAQIELIDLSSLALRPGGTIVIVGSNPDAWQRSHEAVTVDLAAGRPFHAETWVHLLTERGFRDVTVQEAPASPFLLSAPGTDEASAAMNVNFDRLNALLSPSPAYLVAAHR